MTGRRLFLLESLPNLARDANFLRPSLKQSDLLNILPPTFGITLV